MRPLLVSACLALRERLPQVCEVDETFVVYPTDLVQANLREDMVAANPPEILAALKKKKRW